MGQLKKMGPLKIRFCFTKVCASKCPSVCTTNFKFGRKWSFRCTPQNVFFTGLPAHNIEQHAKFSTCLQHYLCSLLLAAGCRLPPAVYMYFLHSLSYLLSAVCRLLLVLCCHLPVSFLRYALFSAVCCLLSTVY
jgi:hypothetical protein